MGISKSRLSIAVAAVAALVFALLPALAPPPLQVELYRVARGPMRSTVADEGKTRLRDLYTVSAPISGRMQRVTLEPGDRVEAGKTVLTTIAAPPPRFHDLREASGMQARVASAQAQRDLAQADIERAKAELAFAEAELARNRELATKGAAAARACEMAEMDLRTKRAALAVAQKTLQTKVAEVAVANAELLDPERAGAGAALSASAQPSTASGPPASAVLAPVSGVLLRKMQESETTVAAGDALVELGDPAKLEVVVEMLSQDAMKVRPGAPAAVSDSGTGTDLRGVVRYVEPYGFTKVSALGIEEQRVNVIVDFADPPAAWTGLGHGFRVDVAIEVWKAENVLKAPLGALFRQGNRWAVYALDGNGAVRARALEVGHVNALEAEILGGLEDGVQVVLHPSDRIEDGRPVVPRRAN